MDDYYPSGYFRRAGTSWADSDSAELRGRIADTIASRDQLKPIRIGENLVVNYNNGP